MVLSVRVLSFVFFCPPSLLSLNHLVLSQLLFHSSLLVCCRWTIVFAGIGSPVPYVPFPILLHNILCFILLICILSLLIQIDVPGRSVVRLRQYWNSSTLFVDILAVLQQSDRHVTFAQGHISLYLSFLNFGCRLHDELALSHHNPGLLFKLLSSFYLRAAEL